MDFAVAARGSTAFKEFLTAQCYLPDRFFNGLHGESRLYFAAPSGQWSIDIVIDELKMSHRLGLRSRLDGPSPTVPLAHLLLSKLQTISLQLFTWSTRSGLGLLSLWSRIGERVRWYEVPEEVGHWRPLPAQAHSVRVARAG